MSKFPNLKNAKAISIDIESFDPYLIDKGPQFHSGKAYAIGYAIGVPDGNQWYYPVRHETGQNMNIDNVRSFLQDVLSLSIPKVGTNLIYDLQGLKADGIKVSGPFHDVQIAEPLIDENKLGQYNLDALAKHYGVGQKIGDDLWQYLANKFGGKATRKEQIKRIKYASPELVATYAKSDVDLPLKIFRKQHKILKDQDLYRIYDIECRLIPMLLEMRFVGVKIDIERVKRIYDNYGTKIKQLRKEIERKVKVPIDSVWNAADLAKIFDQLKLPYPKTPKTQKPSFTSEFLKNHFHPIAKKIQHLRELKKLKDTFIEGYLMDDLAIEIEKVHCQFNQLGAKSGRFSSSSPNLQNIPTRTTEGKEIRKCFVPKYGCDWWKHDYSQIEYRYLVHYSNAEEVKQRYRKNPKLDYHNLVMETLIEYGLEFKGDPRRIAKDCNFGIVYGLGKEAMAKRLGLSLKEAEKLRNQIHEISPYAKNLFDKAMSRASMRGYIFTVLGRRARFPFYEPKDFALSKHPYFKPLKWERRQEIEDFIKEASQFNKVKPGIKRAYVYTALNRLLQGSAADNLKVAMVNLFESGIYKKIDYPHLTVHDELDHSLPKGKQGLKYAKQIKQIMEEAVKISIPMVVDIEKGSSWGDLKEVEL